MTGRTLSGGQPFNAFPQQSGAVADSKILPEVSYQHRGACRHMPTDHLLMNITLWVTC